MDKKNPFSIKKSPVRLINAQAITLENYLNAYIDDGPFSCNSIK